MRRRFSVPVLLASTSTVAAVGLVVTVPQSASAVAGTQTFTSYAAPAALSGASNAGEPSLGVNGTSGAMLYQAGTSTLKLVVNAAGVGTWSDVTAPASVTSSSRMRQAGTYGVSLRRPAMT